MSAAQVFLVIGVILAIGGTLGAAWAVLRTSAASRTIELYQSENEVLGKMNHRLESEVTRLNSKVDTQAAALAALQETVTQRAEVARLAEEIRKEEQVRREEHGTFLMLLKDILAQLKSKRGEIG